MKTGFIVKSWEQNSNSS